MIIQKVEMALLLRPRIPATDHPITKIVVLVMGVVLVAVGFLGKFEVASTLKGKGGVVDSIESSKNPAHVDVASMLFDKQWTDIQDILCPAGRPQADAFGPTLFAMARAELGITSDEFRHVKQQNLDFDDPTSLEKLSYQFYHGRFANATIYVSGNHTIAYIPIWKAANNGIRGWMRTLGGKNGESIYSLRPENLFDDDSTRGPIPKPTCVVTAVRDPISHFLSGYNEIEFRRQQVANNTVLPLYYELPFSTEEERHDRFVQFVRDMALEESRALIHHPFGHVFSMSRVLEVLGRREGAFLSGYLPSLANLSAKFPSFLQKTCHLEEELPVMKDSRWSHTSSTDPDGFYHTAKTVWSEGGKVARTLCILHALDYACWKELPDGVPELCQEVYSRPEFIASIFSFP